MERQSAGVVRTDATDIIILLQVENRICRSNSQDSVRVLSSQFYPVLKFGASTNWSDFVLLYSHKMASLATRNSLFFWHFLSVRPLAFYDVNYTMRLAWPAKREWYGNSKQILWNFQDAFCRIFSKQNLEETSNFSSFWKISELGGFSGGLNSWIFVLPSWRPLEASWRGWQKWYLGCLGYLDFRAPWISSRCDLSGG